MTALRTGFTTGACAAAAAKAAALLLAEGRTVATVEIPLPDGQRIAFAPVDIRAIEGGAEAAIVKNAGDDPDVTDGARIVATVAWDDGEEVLFAAGPGVGTVTKAGLALAPGEPAINPVPRRMIAAALREVTDRGVRITLSIPGGEELAKRTFNPRLGIAGGLSILGTTGIVRPFSCSALRESLRCSLAVAAAAGIRTPILVPGHIGERAAQRHFGVPAERIVEVGNEWGFALDAAAGHRFSAFLILGHPGKLAKLTTGEWDTHSQRSPSAVPTVAGLHEQILGRRAEEATTVEGLFAALTPLEKNTLGNALASEIRAAVSERLKGRSETAVVLIDLGGAILGSAGKVSS